MSFRRSLAVALLGCAASWNPALAEPLVAPIPLETPAPATDPFAPLLAPDPAPAPLAAPAKPSAPRRAPEPVVVDPAPTLQPQTLFATQKAAERYGDIARAGGWPIDLTEVRPRDLGIAVANLRKRLVIEGELGSDTPVDGPAAQIWDKTLSEAVKRFQTRLGLKPTGIVSGTTLAELNVPAEARARALAASGERLSAFNFGFGDRYVSVNLPSASVEAVENGVVVHRYTAIVGDPDHPSPQIAAHINSVNLNPTWTVPVSIIKKEIIPKMQKNPGYLARQKIRILDAAGNEIDPKSIDWSTQRAVNYTLRQDSGAGNSLGTIRIDMPNKHAVYMHDTPSKRAFGADYRFLSHGCVRVQGVFDFAEWLLNGATNPLGGAWDKPALLAKVKEGGREDIRLVKSAPVIWTYLTGWANDDGPAHFRADPYGLDNPPQDALSAAPPKDAPAAMADVQSGPAKAGVP